MRALTLRQPWAWAVLHAGKRIENRTWKPPSWMLGESLAIHAGSGDIYEEDVEQVVRLGGVPAPEEYDVGAIVGVVRVVGFYRPGCGLENPWWDPEQFGWRLGSVWALDEPVPCKGALGLWEVPGEVARAVLGQ